MESKTKKLRMGWIQNLTENEKKIIDDFLEEAAKLKGKALNKKEKQTVKFIARDQVRSIRKEQKSKKQKSFRFFCSVFTFISSFRTDFSASPALQQAFCTSSG